MRGSPVLASSVYLNALWVDRGWLESCSGPEMNINVFIEMETVK